MFYYLLKCNVNNSQEYSSLSIKMLWLAQLKAFFFNLRIFPKNCFINVVWTNSENEINCISSKYSSSEIKLI